jgi:NADH:ubiquinone oxidoreductase subunit 5 (subunit L)/multisubunit Na+/H+ antiporter MnhA subunit
MHEELHDVTDPEVTLADGQQLRRRGRYHRFFQYLSLFSFSMLGVVIAGNMAMVFVFWELVGICSYFLIGFYIERQSASNAANKAFIVNRVGDFGMLIGMMALWASLGTFTFGDRQDAKGKVERDAAGQPVAPGIFSQLRTPANDYQLKTPDKMVRRALRGKQHEIKRFFVPPWPDLPTTTPATYAAGIDRWIDQLSVWRLERSRWRAANQQWIEANRDWITATRADTKIPSIPDDMDGWSRQEKNAWVDRYAGRGDAALDQAITARLDAQLDMWRDGEAPGDPTCYGYWLLVVAGLGIFCGCVGKSAQFPLHVWLPDAMEGPTPVSALVHSATMVAAGVYLVGRFYPAFVPEVLLAIAYIGAVTLFIAATIGLTATDIKRVLAYSTISQLGYMMLALGVGGWLAGMFHLVTHAFFKSLLFLCSGAVIHAVHTNEMPKMGGLLKKMPITALTMLVGCLAIVGASVPLVVGLSGYYSKDAILEQVWLFVRGYADQGIAGNPVHAILFVAAAGGAALTAFYMFRLWFLAFLGTPRDPHRFDHAHEAPRVMTAPLVVLAVAAVAIGWPVFHLTDLIEQARPAGTLATTHGGLLMAQLTYPNEHLTHAAAIKVPVTVIAFAAGLGGFLLAALVYWWRRLDAEEIRQQFRPIHRFLLNKWWFDELYELTVVQPVGVAARCVARVDTRWIDGLIHAAASLMQWLARWQDTLVDRWLVDGFVNNLARKTWELGLSLRQVQTGSLRQYVMFIALGVVALYLMFAFVQSYAAPGL